MKRQSPFRYAAVVLLALVASPRTAAACEDPGLAVAAATGIAGQVAALITTKIAELTTFFPNEAHTRVNQLVSERLNDMDEVLNDRMKQLWADWIEALKLSAAQLATSSNDQSRTNSSMFDNAGQQKTTRALQKSEIGAQKDFLVTDEGCRFDTVAQYRTRADSVTDAVAGGFAKDINVVGNAQEGTPAARGIGAFNQDRWTFYSQTVCDTTTNAGQAGCAGASGPLANATVSPARTLFGRDTLDMADADNRRALHEMTVNMTAYKPLPSLSTDVLDTPQGQDQRLENRSYLAQQDAVSALITGTAGERTPIGVEAPEVADLRERSGISGLPASYQPSRKEINRAAIEKLWDPAYYVSLKTAASADNPAMDSAMVSSPNAALQKEVYLQAFNVTLLFDMLNRMEKIGNVYAIQTANMLKKKKPKNFPPFKQVAAGQ
jgi:hypothetical protein